MPRKRTTKPNNSTRERILDAAETLFAEKGFSGATARLIASRAEVDLGAFSYYFNGKDHMFEEVVRRRAGELDNIMLTRLQEVLAAQSPLLEEIISAIVDPLLEKLEGSDEGWRSYIRLTAVMFSSGDPENLHFVRTVFDMHTSVACFISAVRHIEPRAEDVDLYTLYYVINSVTLNVFQGSSMASAVSDGLLTVLDRQWIRRFVPVFCAGGFAAMVAHRLGKGQTHTH